MGDFAYFVRLGEPLETMTKHPEYFVHFHLNDENHGQPGSGNFPTRRLFEFLRDMGYEGGASCACTWIGDFAQENPQTLRWLQKVRDEVYKL